MQVEQEEEGRIPSGILYGLAAVMVVLGLLLASVFVFRLQPPLAASQPAQTETQAGVASIVMPSGVGSNTALNFSPANATVVVGVNNTVVWTNEDTSPHTVVSKSVPAGAASFSSVILQNGAKFNVTLTVPGTYHYFCSLHPAWMQATIVVKGGAAAQSAGVTVVMPAGVGGSNSLNFQPPSITVVIGVNNTVTWVNRDQSIHTVTATDKSFDSGNITPGASYTRTFTTPGTYTYLCIYHGWMKGTVVVKQPS